MNYDHSNEEILGTSVDGVASSSDSRMADNETEMTFTNADPEYGKRVSEGLAQANQNRENHTSYEASDRAVDKSKQMRHEADPY